MTRAPASQRLYTDSSAFVSLPGAGRQALFDLMPAGICIVDANGCILAANRWYCGYVGYSEQELQSMCMADLLHPDEREREDHVRQALMSGGNESEAHTAEMRCVRKDGSAVWVEFCASMLPQTGHERPRAIFVMHEIETQKRAESALREETERKKQILESIDEGFLLLDHSFRVLQINAEGMRLDGRRADEILGRSCWALWPDIEHQPLGSAYRRAMSERMAIRIEQCCTQGGRELCIEVRVAPVDEGLAVFYRDVTERRQTEQALRTSEARFRTIADAMPQMVWSTRSDGYHDYYNQQWYDYTGVPPGSTDGAGWNDMFHPDDRERAWTAWQRILASGEPYEIQYRLRHRSGQYRWTLGRALPVRDEQGRIVRWMGTCTDIHDQKQAEEELKNGSRRKDEFLAMLAHELRNPLAPISTAAQLLKVSAGDESRVRQASDIIGRQVRHMTELVDDLLDVSRVTRGLVELDCEVFDLKQVLAGAVEQSRPLIEARRHALRTSVDGRAANARGDRTRMIQVIANLLNNAAKYTPPGGEIMLTMEVSGDRARISVSDNGIGIEPALLPRVFELFTQAERTLDRAQGGLGLGLTLVKSIMTLHGGSVEAHSAGPGRGSTFIVSLPLLPEQAAASPASKRAAAEPSSLRLVVVDDNRDAAQTLAALLEVHGHSVRVCHDAGEALALAEREPPHAFILDIGLPDMDGFALARLLRALPAAGGSTLIALSGYGQDRDRARAVEAGFDYHLVKPVDSERLFSLLAKLR